MKSKKKPFIPFFSKDKKLERRETSLSHEVLQNSRSFSFYDDYCDEKSDYADLPSEMDSVGEQKTDSHRFFARKKKREKRSSSVKITEDKAHPYPLDDPPYMQSSQESFDQTYQQEKFYDHLEAAPISLERGEGETAWERKSHVLVSPHPSNYDSDEERVVLPHCGNNTSFVYDEEDLSALSPQVVRKQTTKSAQKTGYSFTFLCLLLVLLFLGLTALASASGYFSLSKHLPINYFVKRQAIFAFLGLVIGLIVQPLPLSSLVKVCALPLILLAYALMFLTLFTPLGLDALGARRWISIGPLPSFQPSEVVKIATVFFLPLLLKTQSMKQYMKDYLSLALILSFSLLILMQRDYSTAALYLVVSLVYALVVGVSWKRFCKIFIFLPIPAIGLLMSEQYRLLRVVSFVYPSLDQQGINYQMANSLGALARGGFWGQGVGQGVYKLGRLPEVHNDFIISSIGEETGIIGLTLICLLFLGFAYFGLKASHDERERGDLLSSDIILGFTLMIVFQVIVNLYVCVGLLPPTGIPLPFFSQGGTNLLLVLVESSLIYKSLREGETL